MSMRVTTVVLIGLVLPLLGTGCSDGPTTWVEVGYT